MVRWRVGTQVLINVEEWGMTTRVSCCMMAACLIVGGTGGVGAAGLALFLVVVLGFLASEDEDLPKVSLL
jgi:hypothetical protein